MNQPGKYEHAHISNLITKSPVCKDVLSEFVEWIRDVEIDGFRKVSERAKGDIRGSRDILNKLLPGAACCLLSQKEGGYAQEMQIRALTELVSPSNLSRPLSSEK